ncbi:3-mercaptopyruvate sulfurtransferase [Dickeya dianthicola]|uniref:Sulfurtransferase n=1 Tax=Dickeya dianthicola TaxID=204039 RepID=A0ABX9NPN0_9GAMM|nr:3-mercaptopyruvate sulfurtransferase [Dickeya dianthicola]MCI4115480.1 3-mercaptopyruvate sulfurtransferase [Dickeya dianthicola]MCI4120511.1 3-mercaptopyruvate sulfurtransferase [Dickeya dianthicola]MCI4123183.1 3-mercaptopyruvate sulfurtransferase [Dickeya dianthicola]MCI4191181.1 3-mercaptopyruvate sulfurtransferase [Dickeya dianthicola]MCI4200907.1 3-mercaptopyruvate sulfurtransferase [Dickeya dianthicola]
MSTSAAGLFVNASWLNAHRHDADITLIDARMLPPGNDTRDTTAEYRAEHLPGAVFFDIESLCDHQTPLPHMMPDITAFADALGKLGLNEQQHLVIYDEGNLFSAPRAWWMLRLAGASHLSILSGGLAGWKQQGLPLEQGDVSPTAQLFHARTPAAGAIRSLDEVLTLCRTGDEQIVDARPAPRFLGEADEPRPGLRRGHIPGSFNVPWSVLVEGGALKPADELAAIFHQAGVDIQRPIVASCGSGVTASVVMLALFVLNAPQVSLYDGSWSEWGARDDVPVVTG